MSMSDFYSERFGPLLLQAMTQLFLEELNKVRTLTGLPELMQDEVDKSLSSKLLDLQKQYDMDCLR